MKKIFAEIGFGNDTFLSTEIEEDNTEHRIPSFVLPKKINEYYLRFWVSKKVYILSTSSGFKIKNKDRNKIKVIFGVGGEE